MPRAVCATLPPCKNLMRVQDKKTPDPREGRSWSGGVWRRGPRVRCCGGQCSAVQSPPPHPGGSHPPPPPATSCCPPHTHGAARVPRGSGEHQLLCPHLSGVRPYVRFIPTSSIPRQLLLMSDRVTLLIRTQNTKCADCQQPGCQPTDSRPGYRTFYPFTAAVKFFCRK